MNFNFYIRLISDRIKYSMNGSEPSDENRFNYANTCAAGDSQYIFIYMYICIFIYVYICVYMKGAHILPKQ